MIPARYTAYRAAGPIVVDGKLDEPSWRFAPKSAAFVDIVTGEPAWYDTRVTILWDDDYLYLGFTAEEPNVSAYLTLRDSRIYQDNDVEVFIAAEDAYYEFEMNALNTVYEVFWIWKDVHKPGSRWDKPEFDPFTQRTMVLDGVGGHVHERGERWGFLDWDFPGLRTAVHVNGVLNSRNGTDKGWTAEVAFPWRGLELLADGRSLPPKDGDIWRIDCSRFQQHSKDGRQLDPPAGWTWNRHGHYDSHIPEVFPYVQFSTQTVDVVERA
ncbi:MAG TPA: carbohydrate-binding family 9-like protein [Bryobacteraceae bacterium]|nr:carbohydrate-binding family 9-like protein [Bryobacteraceae bacterium]